MQDKFVPTKPETRDDGAPGRVSITSFLVVAGIVLMALVNQYLSGQY